MRFSKVNAVRIPSGAAKAIRHNGKVLWSPILARYVSLGDSIAAGHTINDRWEKDYGEGSQYGKNGNMETAIVPGSYTELIRDDLRDMLGGNVAVTSFARSGDTVADLMEKLNHDVVRNAIAKANYVTICIGANDVLQPAMSRLEDYIKAGNSALNNMTAAVDAKLAVLADDNNANSYMALFAKLSAINPNAKYVFTTIYNPYKYLWIDEGNNGFFAPLLNTIPDITILGFDVDNIIKDQLLKADMVEMLYDRVNGLPSWAETNVTKLNTVLRNKITAYGKSNFMLADTKALFEVFPDRPVSAPKHYNDLVSVEYTSGYDTAKMDWGRLWEGSNAAEFWLDLATEYVGFNGVDIDGLANDLIGQIVDKVIVPDVDPHPEEYGHYVLKRSFEDVLEIQALDRHTITYNANGGNGAMEAQTVLGVDGLAAFTNIRSNAFVSGAEGYYFTYWNTSPGGNGTEYSNGQYVSITGDIALYAQWSNIYAVTYQHTNKTVIYTDDETGHMECYALYINGVLMPKLGKFSDGNRPTYYVPYGSTIKVVVSNYNPTELTYDDATCDIYWNGVSIRRGYRGTEYEFTLTSHLLIDFQWKIAGSLVTFDAKSWEDCYITTM